MASPTRWTWVWVNWGSWWWTGRPGMLWFMGSQRVRYDWATELNWTKVKRVRRERWDQYQWSSFTVELESYIFSSRCHKNILQEKMLPKSEITLKANLYREPSINIEVNYLLYTLSMITACPLPNMRHLWLKMVISIILMNYHRMRKMIQKKEKWFKMITKFCLFFLTTIIQGQFKLNMWTVLFTKQINK